jgi:hypothetical protein
LTDRIAAAVNQATKFQLHLLTPLLHRVYVQAMSSTLLPARMHLAPVSAGAVLSLAGIAPTGISSSTITITTTTGTGTGWESVRE